MRSHKKLIEIFRSKGLKATHQRIVITQRVLRSKNHPTAEEVFEKVQRIYPTLSPSTVYNTLKLLKEINLVNELAFNEISRFDPNTKPHINLVCETCGKIIDVEDKKLEKIIYRVSEENFWSSYTSCYYQNGGSSYTVVGASSYQSRC